MCIILARPISEKKVLERARVKSSEHYNVMYVTGSCHCWWDTENCCFRTASEEASNSQGHMIPRVPRAQASTNLQLNSLGSFNLIPGLKINPNAPNAGWTNNSGIVI